MQPPRCDGLIGQFASFYRRFCSCRRRVITFLLAVVWYISVRLSSTERPSALPDVLQVCFSAHTLKELLGTLHNHGLPKGFHQLVVP
jgi:hypothetical protein